MQQRFLRPGSWPLKIAASRAHVSRLAWRVSAGSGRPCAMKRQSCVSRERPRAHASLAKFQNATRGQPPIPPAPPAEAQYYRLGQLAPRRTTSVLAPFSSTRTGFNFWWSSAARCSRRARGYFQLSSDLARRRPAHRSRRFAPTPRGWLPTPAPPQRSGPRARSARRCCCAALRRSGGEESRGLRDGTTGWPLTKLGQPVAAIIRGERPLRLTWQWLKVDARRRFDEGLACGSPTGSAEANGVFLRTLLAQGSFAVACRPGQPRSGPPGVVSRRAPSSCSRASGLLCTHASVWWSPADREVFRLCRRGGPR